jgi:hypothetical protein
MQIFAGWLGDSAPIRVITGRDRMEISEMCLRAALEAFRLGALVAGGKETNK